MATLIHMTPDPDRIRDALRSRLFELHWSQADLARESGVNANTLTAIFKYGRWPNPDTREKIEKALSWPAGHFEDLRDAFDGIARTGESRSADSSEPVVLLDWPPGAFDGMTEAEIAEVKAAATQAGLRIAREIRGGTGG